MRHSYFCILISAAMLLLLAGCQKTGMTGREIRFTAVSQGSPQTKTAYSGVKPATVERINWTATDVVRIYSDKATCSNDPTYYWADYGLSNIDHSGANSTASLSVTSSQGGLSWGEDVPHHFYGIYPPASDAGKAVKGTSTNPFEGTIPTPQNGTATTVKSLEDGTTDVTVYYPPMSSAYLVAYDERSEGSGTSNLQFEPAYTAFHISAGRKDKDITINSVELISTSTALKGDFTMYNAGSGWVFTCPAFDDGTNANNKLTFNFPSPLELTTTSSTVEFVLFALPQDLTELTLQFNVTIEGVNGTRSLKLKTKDAITDLYGHNYAADAWLIFDACRKHYIKGLLVPGDVWDVNNVTTVSMQESVDPWDVEDKNITYGNTDPVVNATKLSVTSSGYSFSIFSPQGKQWQISVLDAPGGDVDDGVTITQTNASSTNANAGTLTGTIGSKVEFTLSRTSGSSGTRYLSFSIVVDGTEYSINSELYPNTGGVPTPITL